MLFRVPCLVFTAFLFWVMPRVAASGATPFAAFHAGFMTPLALMLLAAFVASRLEGRPWTWTGVRDRFRLGQPDRATWAWTLALVTWLILFMPFLPFNGYIRDAFAGIRLYHAPAGYTAFMDSLTDGKTQMLGLPFSWGLLAYYLFALFVFNILGEELWWRGYILPRQEPAFGAKTWLIHGELWTLFRMFYHTNLGILPLLSADHVRHLLYVAQRTKNTWPGIIGHLVSNLPILLLMFRRLLSA